MVHEIDFYKTDKQEKFCTKTIIFSANADDIDFESIIVDNVTNVDPKSSTESRFIRWAAPKSPNGLIVSFDLEYDRISEEKTYVCYVMSQMFYIYAYIITVSIVCCIQKTIM